MICNAFFTQGGGGGTPLYRLYRYVRRQRVCFCSRFGLKQGIYFDYCGLKKGMVCALQSSVGHVFRRSYFFIIWRSDHFPFNVYANRVRAVTACHALGSRAGSRASGLKQDIKFFIRSEIGLIYLCQGATRLFMVLMAVTVMIILNLIVMVKQLKDQTIQQTFKLRQPLARVNFFLHSLFVRMERSS